MRVETPSRALALLLEPRGRAVLVGLDAGSLSTPRVDFCLGEIATRTRRAATSLLKLSVPLEPFILLGKGAAVL